MENSYPKIVQKSITISQQLFPSTYSLRSKYQTFHFAFIYKRNTLLSIGQNSYEFNNKALKFANLYGVQEKRKYPSLHAEISAISKIFDREYIDNSMKMVVIRLNKMGELRNSKPCPACQSVIDALGIERIWYSEKNRIERL